MDSELESKVWRSVQQACDIATFAQLIEQAVDSFKRLPGLDPLVRLHASDIGQPGIQVLRDVLRRGAINSGSSGHAFGYVELRSRLKEHLRCQLQWHLVKRGLAVDQMKEDQLGRDLGL